MCPEFVEFDFVWPPFVVLPPVVPTEPTVPALERLCVKEPVKVAKFLSALWVAVFISICPMLICFYDLCWFCATLG